MPVSEYMNRLKKIDVLLARLLMLCLFLPPHLQVYVAIGACSYFVFRTLSVKQYSPYTYYLWALLLGGGYLLYWLAAPLTPESYRRFVFTLCERKAAYFLLPFVFAITAPDFRKLIQSQLIFFAIGSFIVCMAGNIDFLYHHLIIEKSANALSHVHYRIIFERFTGIHPTYMSLYLCFSICIILTNTIGTTRLQRWFRMGFVYLLLVFVLALFAKAPILGLVLVGMLLLIENRKSLYSLRWVGASLFAVLIGAYAFVPFFRQRATEVLGVFESGKHEQITDNSVHIRQLIWQTDMDLLTRCWLTGVGPGRVLDLLHQRYFFHSIYRGYWVGNFDPHSQYFYDWLSFGVVGIGLLLIVMIMQFRRAILSQDKLYLFLMILISVVFFTESLLSRQQGVLFYSIFTSLFFFSSLSGQKTAAR